MSELLQWATPTVMLALAGFGWKMMRDLRVDLGSRLDRLETRIDRLESALHDVDKRLAVLETRVGHVERRLDQMDRRLDQMDQRLHRLEQGEPRPAPAVPLTRAVEA